MLQDFLLVGGASAYAPGLVQALLHNADRHHLRRIRLYDIAEDRLQIVARLCEGLAKSDDSEIRIEATTDQAEAVQNVDVLLNSSRPGGFEARRIDETLPLEFGIPGQETVGPGGFFFALRSIPAALDLAEDVAQHCPDAIWLNYTNPTNIVAQALADHTDLNVIALCDQSDEDLLALAHAMGIDETVDYRFTCSGLNHATWYHDIRINNRPLDADFYDAHPPQYYDEEHKLRFRLSATMARQQANSMWPNSYLPYYEAPDQFVELAKRIGPRTDAITATLADYYQHFQRQARRDSPRLQHYRGSSGFGDMAADVIAALSDDTGTELVLNVPNRGMIDSFDDHTVVETRIGISSEGLNSTASPPVPESSRPLLQQLEAYQRQTATAAVSGDTQALRRALESNPLVQDSPTAQALLQQARSRYSDFIPSL